MNKRVSMKNVTITIKGVAMTGKSSIMRIIEKSLLEHNFDVKPIISEDFATYGDYVQKTDRAIVSVNFSDSYVIIEEKQLHKKFTT